MKLLIDTDHFARSTLIMVDICYLYALLNNIEYYPTNLVNKDKMINEGWLIRKEDKLFTTKKSVDAFKRGGVTHIDDGEPIKLKERNDKVEDWIQEYREIFPKGIKTGGYLVRADKKACLTKMKRFVKDYPEFPKSTILKATKSYVDSKAKERYMYMQMAHYFILKGDTSNLASWCEQLPSLESTVETGSNDI